MTEAPLIKGFCPGALRPMQSGDGLVVRIRPFAGRLLQAQASGIASLAKRHGNGQLDLSSRGNLQIRGVTEGSYPELLAGLRDLDLLDESAAAESRRNILVAPFWEAADGTQALASALAGGLATAVDLSLPAKFGFAIDIGVQPVLASASADVRVERGPQGGLLLVADGSDAGKPVTPETAVAEAVALARWFAAHRGAHKRMARLLAAGRALPDGFDQPRLAPAPLPKPGLCAEGRLVGFAFGQISARTLSAIASRGNLRMTPWRMVVVENTDGWAPIPDVITAADDPLLSVVACSGAPRCPQAHAPTRPLARSLAAFLAPGDILHVSGCAKGCAHPAPANITVTAIPQGYSLIRAGLAGDAAACTALSEQDIIKAL